MMEVPTELSVLIAVIAVLSVGLTFLIRSDFRTAAGRFDVWASIEGLVGLFFILVMVAAATLQIIVRYFNVSTLDLQWTEELGRLALVWGAFWGAAALQRADDQVCMTAVYDMVPEHVRLIFRILGDVLALAVLAPLVWYGWQTARNLDIMLTIALGTPLSIFAYPVPIAGALMMLHTAILLARRLATRQSGQSASDIVAEV